MELPFKVKFSHLGNLSIKTPWSFKGGVQALEIELEDLYLILAPINSKNWKKFEIMNA